MQHALLTMSIPAPSTSVEVGLVKRGAGCLMVVSFTVLGVKITKAGTFSSPHSAATLLEATYYQSFCDRTGGRSGKDEEAA